ncbi:MAG TPA: hypothetical protein VII73_07790 [Caulobacteraceae bacterium]
MTTLSDVSAPAPLDPPKAEAAPLSPTRPFIWSVRREVWENRSLIIGPLVAAGVVLLGCLLGALHAPHMKFSLSGDAARQAVLLIAPYGFAAGAVLVTGVIVGAFYCLGALHNERRDRSILFWKSLPVSDLTTVLSKASIPLVVLPVILFAVVVATQLILLVLGALVALVGGAPMPWTRLPLLQMWLVLLYGLTVLSLWYAPIWGWLLLVSVWARRAPFLWAVLPPLALCVIEKIAFDTGHLATLLNQRLGGLDRAFTARMGTDSPQDFLPRMDAARFFGTPDVWIGLVVAAVFLAGAVWLRRRREPI